MRIAVAGGTGTVGRHTVDALEARGHDVVTLARSRGIDLMTGVGVEAALRDVDAVVDLTGPTTTSADASSRFFSTVTSTLLRAERAAGVNHHIALSIVGAAQIGAGYYAGKKVQEELVAASGTPWTIVRATQFHEFAAQIIPQGKAGPVQLVPDMVSQPIAARECAVVLAEIATGEALGMAPELAGPRVERMSDLVRRYLRATGSRRPVIQVRLRGPFWVAARDGSVLPGDGACLGTQTFGEWLAETVPARLAPGLGTGAAAGRRPGDE